ncbi:MAG: PEGA domain-containing protein [Lachnospira sp.]
MNIQYLKMLVKKTLSVFVVLALAMSAVGCGGSKKGSSTIIPGSSILPAPKKDITEVPTNTSNEIVIKGVLKRIDSENKKMYFLDVNTGTDYEVPYTGGTDIKTKYDTIIAAVNLEIGSIYDVTCDKKGTADKIYGAKDAWKRSNVSGIAVNESSKTITSGPNDFSYSSNAVVMSAGEEISIAEVVKLDNVSLVGIDNTIYSIIVEQGHGYIEFTGIDLFEGGYASLGNSHFLEVTKGMLVTAPVGTYDVEVQKGNLVARKEVMVSEGQQVTVDFSDTQAPSTKTGAVNFKITPSNAVMTIDGVEVDYSRPVTLSYGPHRITLVANHYEEYAETIIVNNTYYTKVIDMVAKDSSSTTKTTAASKTQNYAVKVTAPVGAVLYVDSVYVGIVPCTFKKRAGNRIITLSKSGFKTVSYTISISDSEGDVTYAFPDMQAENGSNEKPTTEKPTTEKPTTQKPTKEESTKEEETKDKDK